MKCYLIAKKLSHSFSKPIHNALSDYSYDYKELLENELEDFLKERDFDGLNVTIPYKTAVMSYLDELSPEAEKIGASYKVGNLLSSDVFYPFVIYLTSYFLFAYSQLSHANMLPSQSQASSHILSFRGLAPQ